MEAVYYNRKLGGMHYPLAFIAMLSLLLLNANSCSGGAAVGIQLVKSNTTFGCDGRLDECLMEEDLELELLINPYISRILQSDDHPTSRSGDANKEAIPCGKPGDPKPYAHCIGQTTGNDGGNCSKYKRTICESGPHD